MAILVSQGVDRQRKKGLGEVEITMNRYKRWSERKYNNAQRMMGIILGGIVFWIVIPFLIVVGSAFMDSWLSLPKVFHRWLNPVIVLVLMVAESKKTFLDLSQGRNRRLKVYFWEEC